MYPNKRKCTDVDLETMTSHPARSTPKRSKSSDLLAYNGGDKLQLFTFSDQDYGEQGRPSDAASNDVTNQRQYHNAKRRLNMSRDSSLDIDNDETFVKTCYCDSQNIYGPRYTRPRRPHKHTSPDWKSTPSLPTLYSNYSNTYCRHSNTSNGRLNKLDSVDICNECRGGPGVPQHNQCIQNRLVRERSVDMLVDRRINIIDPLSKGHITSPGLPVHDTCRQTQRCLPAVPCDNCGSQNVNEIIIEQGERRSQFLGLQRNYTTNRSVETLDIETDLVNDEDTPDSAHKLLNNTENTETKSPNNACHSCALGTCSSMCTSYRKKFYIVLTLNLILVIMNIIGLIGIPAFITIIIGTGIEDGRGGVAGAIRSQNCINCNDLNPVCDISSLGFIRKTGNQCCVKSDGSLFKTMMKAVDEYLDCSVNGSKDISHVPVIQFSAQTGAHKRPGKNRLKWNKHADVAPNGLGYLRYENSEIRINKPGNYFIYTKVMYKKKSDNQVVGFSIMKNNDKNESWTVIDTIEEHCFTATTPMYSIHASHLITVHKFGDEESVYVELNNKDDFDNFSTDTKIVIFYIRDQYTLQNTTTSNLD